MRKWIAALMAVILLCSGGLAAAEAPAPEDTGTEGAPEAGSLAEYHEELVKLLNDEQVQRFLQMSDVQELLLEGGADILVWMIQNRPVTMQILEESGVGENERRCVDKIWDSADRVAAAWRDYSATEDGQRLRAELQALRDDPEIRESGNQFLKMISSDDVTAITDSIWSAAAEGADAAAEGLPESDASPGELIVNLLDCVGQSEWARDSAPALLQNENLQRVLIHLTEENAFYDVVMEEHRVLAEDPDVRAFIEQVLQDGVLLLQTILNESGASGPTSAYNAISEEAVP